MDELIKNEWFNKQIHKKIQEYATKENNNNVGIGRNKKNISYSVTH